MERVLRRRALLSWLAMLGGSGMLSAMATARETHGGNIALTESSGSAGPEQVAQAPIARPIHLERVADIRYQSAPTSIMWHPDGQRIAAAIDFGRRVAISEVPSGRLLAEIRRCQTLGAKTVAFTPDGKFLVSTPADPDRRGPWALGIWDAATGELVQQVARPRAPDLLIDDTVREVHLSADGRYAVACGRKGRNESLVVFDAKSWEFLRALHVFEGWLGGPAAVSRDGRIAAQWSRPADRFAPVEIAIFDPGSGAQLVRFPAHRPEVKTMAWSVDGQRLLSGAGGLNSRLDPKSGKLVPVRDEDPIRVWEPQRGQLVRSLRGEFDPATTVDWHPAQGMFVVNGARGHAARGSMLTFWDVTTGELRLRYQRPGDAFISSVAFSPDGVHIAIVQDNVISIDRVIGI
jgi:WD40 repeat protein